MKEEDFKLEWASETTVNTQNMFSAEELKEMHYGIKHFDRLREYFDKTKERLRDASLHNEYDEDELAAGAAALLVWPFLGKEELDEETIFKNAELILALMRDEIRN